MVWKGWGVEIIIPEIDPNNPIGYAQSVDLDVVYGTREEHELGRPQPIVLQTPYRISGSIRRLYVDKKLFNLILDSGGDIKDKFTSFEVRAIMKTPTPIEGKYIIVKNCVAESSAITIDQDDYVIHDLDFRADTFQIKDTL